MFKTKVKLKSCNIQVKSEECYTVPSEPDPSKHIIHHDNQAVENIHYVGVILLYSCFAFSNNIFEPKMKVANNKYSI